MQARNERQLRNIVKDSPCEVNSRSAGQEMLHLLRKRKAQYHSLKNVPVLP
jgi:hypothetical protein